MSDMKNDEYVLQRMLKKNPEWMGFIVPKVRMEKLPIEPSTSQGTLIFNGNTGLFIHGVPIEDNSQSAYFRCYVDFTDEVFGIMLSPLTHISISNKET